MTIPQLHRLLLICLEPAEEVDLFENTTLFAETLHRLPEKPELFWRRLQRLLQNSYRLSVNPALFWQKLRHFPPKLQRPSPTLHPTPPTLDGFWQTLYRSRQILHRSWRTVHRFLQTFRQPSRRLDLSSRTPQRLSKCSPLSSTPPGTTNKQPNLHH